MVKIEKEGAKVTVYPRGRIDATCAPQFASAMEEAIVGATELVIDCTGLKYISSSGLRAVMLVVKAMDRQGKMRIINVDQTIYETLELTGFTGVCDIEMKE